MSKCKQLIECIQEGLILLFVHKEFIWFSKLTASNLEPTGMSIKRIVIKVHLTGYGDVDTELKESYAQAIRHIHLTSAHS